MLDFICQPCSVDNHGECRDVINNLRTRTCDCQHRNWDGLVKALKRGSRRGKK